MNAALQVRGLRISFDGKQVVDDVSFAVDRGECVAIVGSPAPASPSQRVPCWG